MTITAATLQVRVEASTSGAERNLSGFSSRLSNVLGNVQGQAGGATAAIGGVTKALGGVGVLGALGGGFLAVRGIQAITGAVTSLGGQALQTYADYERLGMALQSLSAREMVRFGQAENMSEAMALSTERAKELQGWIEKLAIESPFTSGDIANSLRLGMSFGFTSQQAQRLTQAMTDYAAGSGASSEAISRATLALGQMQVRGKVAAQELNQLTEVGIGARDILAKAFGVSTAQLEEMISAGLVPANAAIEAIAQSLEGDFGGAAKAQANTFSGLISSLSELKDITLRDFFGPMFQEAQPYLAEFIATLQSPEVKAAIEGWGQALGDFAAGKLASLNQFIKDLAAGELQLGEWRFKSHGELTTVTFGDQVLTGPETPIVLMAKILGDNGADWLEKQSKASAGWLDRSADKIGKMFASLAWPDMSGVTETFTSVTGWLDSSATNLGNTLDSSAAYLGTVFEGLHWPTIELPDWVNRLFGIVDSGIGYTPGGSHNFPRNPKSTGKVAPFTAGYAVGTPFHPGGMAIVGEEGPELVNLPRGAQVIPNRQTMQMLQAMGLPGYASGTGAVPTGGSFYEGNLSTVLSGLSNATKEFKQAVSKFGDMLAGVPGLFGASPVTQDQMDMAALGVPQNFADDYLRRLTDEVLNGVDWAGVDIQDAAQRAGIDPTLPAEAILKMFGDAWRDSSLFADPKNLDLINTAAVEEQLQQQMAAQAGRANIMQFLGLTEEEVNAQGIGLSNNILAGLIQGISPEVTTPIGAQLFSQIDSALTGAPNGETGKAFADAVGGSFATEGSVKALQDAGANIAEQVYRGYMNAVTGDYDWTPPVTSSTPSTPSTGSGAGGSTGSPTSKPGEVGKLAAGTEWWRGGWSWVGERGPELVNLPRGAQVLNARQSAQAAQGGATINMQVIASANVDAEAIANRVMAILKRRMS